MRVLLVGNFASDQQFSMQGFTHVLASSLPNRDIDVSVISAQSVFSKRMPGKGLHKWLAYVDKYILFQKKLKSSAKEADLIHVCDQGNGIYVSLLHQMRPLLLTCHDLFAIRASRNDPDLWSLSATGKMYQKLIWQGVRRADNIACVSEATQRDLSQLLNQESSSGKPQISCIPNGLYKAPIPMRDEEKRSLLVDVCKVDPDQRYLLHVGGNQPYKNRLGLLKIYAALRKQYHDCPPLVLAGKALPPTVRKYIEDQKLSEYVLERSGLNDHAIQALYSHAVALIFPSTMEGFGLPILEAQACGCPVFTTDQAPMTEAGKDAAVYFSPGNVELAAQILSRTLQDPGKLNDMTARGKENIATNFTTERMVDDYRTLYKRMVNAS